ncbi:hypothetical protein ACWDTD_13740 [Gordonia sp. NPDC003425]
MSWQEFIDEYSTSGAIRLGSWSLTPTASDLVECRATIAYADRIMSLTGTASGAMGAMTSILYDIGAAVQILRLHQRETAGTITTFVLCERDRLQRWGCGVGASPDEANINALVAGANRLLEIA